MDARATLSGRPSSTRILGFFVTALLVALLVGGAGGYLVRAVTDSVTTTAPTFAPQPFVIERAPYSSPAPSTAPSPTRDPNGFAIPI